jgi:DNA helicase TIP49 (TBP-interacting protein)
MRLLFISGTEILSTHGMPLDLLDRIMIIRTLPYGMEDMVEVMNFISRHMRFILLFRFFEYVRKLKI